MKEIADKLERLFSNTELAFKSESFEQIQFIINEKKEVYDLVKQKIVKQVERTRGADYTSPKNTTLYFTVLLETKDLLNSIMNLLKEFHNAYDNSIEPAVISDQENKPVE